MLHVILMLGLLIPVAVHGEEGPWVPMSGAEIKQSLTDRTLKYASATQSFYASGKTLYDAGRPSWGYWRVEKGQYCSQWPPNDLWACYGLEKRAGQLWFVGEGDDITEAVYLDEK